VRQPDSPPHGTETILLVVDQPRVRDTTRRALERFGYQVLEAESGEQALQVAESVPGRIDLLVTDVVMPGMSGPQVAERFQSLRPGTPVLYLTGYTEDELTRHGVYDTPGVWFLEKPFAVGRLASQVREILDGTANPAVGSGDAIRQSETLFRSLIEHSMDLIVIVGGDGRFKYGSPSVTRFLGYEQGELTGALGFEWVHPDDTARIRAAFAKAVGGRAEEVREEFRFRHKDGSWRTFEAVVTNLVDEPAVAGLVVNARDITEQRALEGQLRQAQRLEAVGRLAGGVAHDFNNILTAIHGYCELLLTTFDRHDQRRQDVQEIRSAAERAASLTRQLLAFSRKQVLQPATLDVNALISGLQALLGRMIGEDVTLETALEAHPATVRADPGQLEQVIANLVVNSRDAMPTGGRITLETATVDLDESYVREHAGASVGRFVVLAVTDNGTGMDAETQTHIFEPFFTTKETGKGTGLGLSTVYGIVKQSGGFIWVYSEPGRGTTFKIYLPAAEGVTAAVDLRPALPEPPGGSETVLIVEDDPAVREVATQILRRKGYRILQAPDGATALALARTHVARVSLVITDLVMPGMSGRELADAVRAEQPGVRVLYMSGYTDDAVVRQGVLNASAPYLQKPFTAQSLALKVRELMDRLDNAP
jgi:PAS domain S-box-containing protein